MYVRRNHRQSFNFLNLRFTKGFSPLLVSDSNILIEAIGLSKYYGRAVGIEDVSFSIVKGEIVGLVGPNGSGKTTVMRLLTGFLAPSEGTARIVGHDTAEASLEARGRVGYLPESVPLYADMTVRQYLNYMGTLHGLAGAPLRSQVEETIETVHASQFIDTLINKLSKGYRQRVGIAQAILHRPPVLILDEPTAGIDPAQVIQTRQIIRSLGTDHTVLLSTHILSEVSMVCDRVIIMNDGHVAADGDPSELAKGLRGTSSIQAQIRGPHEEIARALASIPGVRRVSHEANQAEGPGNIYSIEVEQGKDVSEEIPKMVVGNGWALLRMQPDRLPLERVFMHLTEEGALADS